MPRRTFLLALLLAGGCFSAPYARRDGPREVQVEAEGWSPAGAEDQGTARTRALVEAQRKAVEKAVGVTLRGSTVVEQAVNIQQTVRANVGGTIRRYEVLWERAEDSFYKVRIRAVVLYRPPGEDGRPARAVRVCVRVAGDKVASAIRAALLDADFQLSDDQASADVVVTGGVETSGRSDSRLGGFFSHQAKAFLDVLDLRTGKVDQRSFEASAIDLSDQAAYDAALEKAGQGSGIAIATLLEEPDELRLSRLERADRL